MASRSLRFSSQATDEGPTRRRSRKCRLDSYLALALLRASGVVSGIGVSNFLKRHLEESLGLHATKVCFVCERLGEPSAWI